MNKVILTGNLTKDPELTTTQSGINYCRFTLAVQRKYANENGEHEADFPNIIVWRKLAENCYQYLKKGSKATVVGQLQTRTYENTKGEKCFAVEVVAEEVEFLNRKTENNGDKAENAAQQPPKQATQVKFEPIDDENLPF